MKILLLSNALLRCESEMCAMCERRCSNFETRFHGDVRKRYVRKNESLRFFNFGGGGGVVFSLTCGMCDVREEMF